MRSINDYLEIGIHVNGIRLRERLNRLNVIAFYGKHENLVVNYKNGKKLDNKLENLEFVIYRENNVYALMMELHYYLNIFHL